LGVFVGGWTLDAATAVCGNPGDREDDLLERLAVLVDNSLVPRDTARPDSRFRLLQTGREVAAEDLATSDEADAVRKRHMAYFATLAEQSEPKLRRAEQMRWLARLDTEQDNFRAALAQSLDTTGDGYDPVAALRVTGGLGWFWWMRGPYGEARRWFSAALAFGQGVPVAIRARALHAAGMMAVAQADFEGAGGRQEERLGRWLEVGDPWGIAWERGSVGVAVRRARGDYARRTALIEQALAGFRELGDAWCTAWCLNALAGLPREGTSPGQGDAMHPEALRPLPGGGGARGTGNALEPVARRGGGNGGGAPAPAPPR